jgi:DNA ligase 1
MKPMLAHIFDPSKHSPPYIIQPKLNGVRALYQNGRLYSRDEIPWNYVIVSHICNELVNCIPPNWILDGELYLHGWSLQRINSAIAVKRLEPNSDTKHVTYNVYDSVSTATFVERFRPLCPLIRDLKRTHIVPTHICPTAAEADKLFTHYRKHHYEGIMYRSIDTPYVNKRSNNLLKRKGWLDGEFEITDVEEGKGKCTGILGALVCVTPSGVPFRVGTGFTDQMRTHYWTHRPIGSYAKVQYLNLSDTGCPMNTSFIHLIES